MYKAQSTGTIEAPARRVEHDRRAQVKPEPRFNVVLIDDDEHTYDYVVRMLATLFGRPVEEAFQLACEIDAQGRVIVDTTHRERAELKRDLIKNFGADPLLNGSNGSMHAIIEPVPV